MSNIDIARAWKDREYRHSLSEEQRSQLPENPAGAIAISNADMESICGGKILPPNSLKKCMIDTHKTCPLPHTYYVKSENYC